WRRRVTIWIWILDWLPEAASPFSTRALREIQNPKTRIQNPMISLGIDSGTQSTKTIALDMESGAILASASKSYELIDGLPPGHLEQDPQVWLDAVEVTV